MRTHLPSSDAAASPRPRRDPNRWLRREAAPLLLSISIQMVIGLLFGHIYDMRIFMAAGYQVAHLQNPYPPQDLSAIFHNAAFSGITTVGYPPPWPLVLGGIYALVHLFTSSFLAYNLAIKLPLIAGNVGLAYLTASCLRRLAVEEEQVHRSWILMLFNPFLLYASAAWGQFDTLVASLSLASLMLLDRGKWSASAILLAMAVSFKPTAMPLVIVPFFFLRARAPAQNVRFHVILSVTSAALWIGPFLLFNWDPTPILQKWNAHFVVGGGLTPLSMIELWQDTYRLPGNWWWIGLLWIPALLLASRPLWNGIRELKDLVRKSTGLVMVFFLTRAWLSEPNLVLALPLVVILVQAGELPRPWLHTFWILPLLFGIFNVSLPQLFFPSMPRIMDAFLAWMERIHTARLIAKVVLVVPWQILGWSIVRRCLSRSPTA